MRANPRQPGPAFESAVADADLREMSCAMEVVAFESKYVKPTDEEAKNGRLGRLIYEYETADVITANGHLFPRDVVAEAVAFNARNIENRQVYGRCDHPKPSDETRYLVTTADAAILVSGVEMVTPTRKRVTVDILDNPHGRQVLSIKKAGGNPALSQRAWAFYRDPTDEERMHFAANEDRWFEVATVLRLVTYDIVGQPGMTDAAWAEATESKGPKPMTLKELLEKHPQLMAQHADQARADERTKLEAEFKAQREQIANEAVNPLNEQLATERETNQSLRSALESVKPVLVKAGIVNEKITDEQAAQQLEASEAARQDLDKQLKAANEAQAELKRQLDEIKAKQAASEAIEAVREKFADHAHLDAIVDDVKSRKIREKEPALEAAQRFVDLLERVGAGSADQSAGGGGMPKPNFQKPEDGSGGGGNGGGSGKGGTADAASQAALHLATSGSPAF